MGVTQSHTTDDGLTPICNLCGIALCWDISPWEYEEEEEFWDNWCCKHCDPNYRKKRWKNQNE